MTRRPNILLIVADDLAFSDLGAFGGEIHTPHLDALAYSGVRFTDFHAAAACSPTRAMLLTGVDHHLAGLGAMSERLHRSQRGKPGYEGHLNDRVVTITELLRCSGYATFMSGKWHLGSTPQTSPQARGFERSFCMLFGADNHFGSSPKAGMFPGGQAPYLEDDRWVHELPQDFYSSDAFTDRIIDYLRERPDDGRPFFAYLPFTAPHWPLQAPAESMARYRGRYAAGPAALRARRLERLGAMDLAPHSADPHPMVTRTADWTAMSASSRAASCRAMEAYAGMVERLDWNVGRLVEHLRSRNDFDDTLIFFLSDNGPEGSLLEAFPVFGDQVVAHIAEHYDNRLENIGRPNSFVWYGPLWAQAGSAPSRLYKFFTSEGGIRVVAFAAGAGVARVGEVTSAFCTVMDLAATLLDLAGVEHPGRRWRGRDIEPMEGCSMRPLLGGAAERVHRSDDVICWELFGRCGVRRGELKALLIPEPDGPGRWQLYDLAADPGEVRDLASAEPGMLGEMIAHFETYARDKRIVMATLPIY